jgi:hypothetical protein
MNWSETMRVGNSFFNGIIIAGLLLIFVFTPFLNGCGGGSDSGTEDSSTGDTSGDTTTDTSTVTTGNYVVFAWNDKGMHTIDSTYDNFVISPPDNNLWAQVIRIGDPPVVTTTGLTVAYSIENNTGSANKSQFGQFWEYMQSLFGVTKDNDIGLTGNGLSGTMQAATDHFTAEGIPLTPVNDDGTENGSAASNQIAVITVKDSSGATVAETKATIPVSADMDCAKCHNDTTAPADILALHDSYYPQTTISGTEPVLCIKCHTSSTDNLSAYTTATGSDLSTYSLAEALHSGHSGEISENGDAVACEDCHVSSTIRTVTNGNNTNSSGKTGHAGYACEDCHGTSWDYMVVSPSCTTADCHAGITGVGTASTPYHYSTEDNHGGLYCATCHQGAHALTPSSLASDNYQAIQYQGKAMALSDCRSCHRASTEGTVDQFNTKHAGTNGRESGCNICHTGWTSGVTAEDYPHEYSWQYRE